MPSRISACDHRAHLARSARWGLVAAALLVASPLRAQAPVPNPAVGVSADEDLYEAAYRQFMRGDLPAAIAALEGLLSRSLPLALRARASELRRVARDLQEAGVSWEPSGITTVDRIDDPSAGRIRFVGGVTVAAFYSGFVLMDLLDLEDSFRGSVLVVAGATAAGFAGTLVGTRDRDMTLGMSASFASGLSFGTTNTLLLLSPLNFEDRERGELFVLGGAAIGSIAGTILGDRLRPTEAQGSAPTFVAGLGLATAALATVVLRSGDGTADQLLLTMLAGYDLGFAAGVVAARDMNWAASRLSLVALSAFVGAVGGWSAGALADRESGRLMAATTAAGMWIGTGLGALWTGEMQPDKRFRSAPPVSVVPLPVRGGGGLALAGAF